MALTALAGPAKSQSESTSIEISLEEGTNFAVTVSPEGARLVFDLQGRLWSLPAEGGEAEALTDGLGDDRIPDWSPDGSRLVFQSFRKGNWDIWSVRTDGSGLQPLTDSPYDEREPVWSPDGTRVAFASDRSGNYDIWTLDVVGGGLTQISRSASEDYMPAWSPDGSWIAFISDRGEKRATELWKNHVTSGQEEWIATFDGKAASPSWSPDGRQIALRLLELRSLTMMGSTFDEGLTSRLVTVGSEGGELTTLYESGDVFPFRPAWTRGGEVFFTADGKIRRLARSAKESETVPFQATVRLDRRPYRRRRARIPKAGERLAVRGIVRPSVSPDGSRIAFTALGDLWVAPLEGSKPLPLTRDQYLDSDASWSPDGRRLVYSSDRMGSMDLWVKDVESGPQSGEWRLTDLPGAEFGPAWSPDGRRIAFLDERYNIYTVEIEGEKETQLIYATRRGAGLPSWSSDSRHLAVAVNEPFSGRFREGANRIKVISVDSKEERILDVPSKSFGSRNGDGPVWSPDGRKMAFAFDGGLWICPVTPSGEVSGLPKRIVDEAADFISWFPGSESLLYLASHQLKQVDLGGGASRVIPVSLEYEVMPAGGNLLIRGARLIDGTGRAPRDDVDIRIEGSRIHSVEAGGATDLEGLRVIDATGKTVIPGLIESHTHLALPEWGTRHGPVWLAHGVTSIRSVTDLTYRVLEERETIESGRRIGPRVFFTGFSFDGDRIYYKGSLAIDDEEELQKELERAFRLDYDLVKTYVRLPDDLQRRVIEAAHQQGTFVTSHEIYPAVAYGVDGVEHLWGTSRRGFSPKVTELRKSYRDVVDLVSDSGVYFTPTLAIQGGFRLAWSREPDLMKESRFARLCPGWVWGGFQNHAGDPVAERQAIMEPLLDTVAAVARAGGRVIAGTDSPIVPYGLSLILEIELLSEAGLGPLEAIRSATQLAAEALGADRDLGTVEPGKLADLVILGADPTEDIRNLRQTDQVVLGGRVVTVRQILR